MIESKTGMNVIRRNPRYKSYLPLLVGLVIGLSISYFLKPDENTHCPVRKSLVTPHTLKYTTKQNIAKHSNITDPEPVKPKASHFNYDFRPYFVYSELGFHYEIILAVITTEAQLLSYGVAINNTWLQNFPKVIFFTPYSKSANFHERYNNVLNLNVIQLADILDDSLEVEFSFRVLQYLKEHYVNTYNWFLVVQDKAYVNTNNVLTFLKSLNSSTDLFLGHPVDYEPIEDETSSKNDVVLTTYCKEKNGYILSRSLLQKLEHLSLSNFKEKEKSGVILAKSILLSSGRQCIDQEQMKDLFFSSKHGEKNVFSPQYLKYNAGLANALVLYPVETAKQMLEIHQYFLLPLLQKTYEGIHELQEKMKDIQQLLPEEVPEKTLHWPVGFAPPFKPSSRFEVIQWTYFDTNLLYGYSDTQPVSKFNTANRKDKDDILNTVKQAIEREHQGAQRYDYKLLNGYRRLDPQRGAEYIIDLIKSSKNANTMETKRVYLLRPFTKLEALPMPAATEQKGIHLVLPVLREDVTNYEHFLQMYKRVCLQTGENVVLLTVFINVRVGQFEGEEREDPFVESKNLIARYKHSYMWAQLPWLQVGVKKVSQVLIMDIVSMKLPSNALIFLVSLTTDFTTNFMNRCRVNVVCGSQVFFPIPFAEYEPKLVYKTQQKPTFVDVHRNNGFWDDSDHSIGCFNNKDFKDVRMLRDDFLDENQSTKRTILDVFNESKLQVFRSVDAELRKRYSPMQCPLQMNVTSYTKCTKYASQRLGSRSQLAQILFQNEKFTA